MPKPGVDPSSGISLGDALRLPKRHPACRRREAQSGSRTERENLAGDAKGRSTSGSNREVLVSRHPAIRTTERLTFAPAGLSPAEPASLYWTHIPYVNLSIHTARVTARRLPPSAEPSGSSRFDPVGPSSTAMTCPLCSTGITPLHHYYGAVRPSPAHRYFRPHGWSRLCLSLSIAGQVLTFHTRARLSFAPPTCRMPLGQSQCIPQADPGRRVNPRFWHRLIRFRHFIDGSLALASLNRACRDHVPTFPQRSPPAVLTTAACGGLRSTTDCRPRRHLLHLSYSCAWPFGPAMLVTQDPFRTKRGTAAHGRPLRPCRWHAHCRAQPL